jgi:hypothetical protein
MNQLIHTTSPTLVLHQLGWGIPHAMWRNHAYAFYLDLITNGNGNTKFSLAWTLSAKPCALQPFFVYILTLGACGESHDPAALPSTRHPLPIHLGVLCRPSDGVDVSNRKFLLYCVNICHRAKCRPTSNI